MRSGPSEYFWKLFLNGWKLEFQDTLLYAGVADWQRNWMSVDQIKDLAATESVGPESDSRIHPPRCQNLSCLTSRVLWKLKAIDGAMEAWSDDMI